MDDDIDALFAAQDSQIQPIYTPDAFTYWIQRLVGIVIYGDIPPPDPKIDSPEVLRDKQLYSKAVDGSRGFDPFTQRVPIESSSSQHSELMPLLRDAHVLTTNARGVANFYPIGVAYAAESGDELAVLEFLHVLHHLEAYARAIISRCCIEAGDAAYLGKTYSEIWQWLAANGCHELPVSKWPEKSTVPFVQMTRALYKVWETGGALHSAPPSGGGGVHQLASESFPDAWQ